MIDCLLFPLLCLPEFKLSSASFARQQARRKGRVKVPQCPHQIWAAESSLRELGNVSLEDALGYLDLLAEQKPE